jgi:hypothetical protein
MLLWLLLCEGLPWGWPRRGRRLLLLYGQERCALLLLLWGAPDSCLCV